MMTSLAVQPTVSGRLLGHLFLGRDLVRDTARELGDVNPELVQLLEHIVITHLTLPEWGSPRLPLIPECIIIHHADDLDAKMEMYVRCLTRDKEPGDFTGRDPVLGRQLYKGRKAGISACSSLRSGLGTEEHLSRSAWGRPCWKLCFQNLVPKLRLGTPMLEALLPVRSRRRTRSGADLPASQADLGHEDHRLMRISGIE